MLINHIWSSKQNGPAWQETKEWYGIENFKWLQGLKFSFKYIESKKLTKEYILKLMSDDEAKNASKWIEARISSFFI